MLNVKNAVKEEFKNAKQFYDNNIRQSNEDAYDYYNGVKPTIIDKDIPEVFQSVVSSDVADVIEHTLADIMPAFASEAPVQFRPESFEDEKQAQIETQLVNDLFIQSSGGFIKLTTSCKDALMLKLGAMEIQTYEKVSVSYKQVSNASIQVLTSIIKQEEAKGHKVDKLNLEGELVQDEFQGIVDSNINVLLRVTRKTKQLFIDSFPPNELRVNEDNEELDLDNARFVARERVLTASELVEIGIDKDVVDELPDYSSTYDQEAPQTRGEYTTQPTAYDTHSSNKQIRVAFCYYYVDEDEDGIAERRKFLIAGDLESTPKFLIDEPCSTQPYAIGVPFIDAHRTYGISLFEKIKQVQDIKTKIIRQLLTAGERAVRGRIGVLANGANLNDLRESMFGGIVRMTHPNGVMSLPMDRYPAEITDLLQQMDKRRRESGGSAVDKASEEIAVGGDTAHGLERMMSAMEQLNSMVAKILAETLVRQIYTKIHYNLRKHFSGPISAKIDGNWVSSTPSDWPERKHAAIGIGLTTGDRMRQAANYTTLINEHKELIKLQSVLTNEQAMYNLLIARANALMIPNAHSYYVDPQSKEGQAAAQRRAQSIQQQQQQQERVQLMNLELLPKVEQIKAAGDAQVQEMKNTVKELELQLGSIKDTNEFEVQLKDLELKLIELNAKYDGDEVPDAKPAE